MFSMVSYTSEASTQPSATDYLQWNFYVCHRGEDGEKKEKKKEVPKKKKTQLHRSSKSDEPDLQESAFWKKIIAYQRKLLVRDPHIKWLRNDVLKLISPPFIKKSLNISP